MQKEREGKAERVRMEGQEGRMGGGGGVEESGSTNDDLWVLYKYSTLESAREPMVVVVIPHWPLPAVRDLTRDGRLSTYDEMYSSCPRFHSGEKCACMGHPLKLPPPTKLIRLGHFPPASQAGRLAGPVFYTISFL